MARESQGLQIALIVFVMFTIILGIATFISSKEYGKTKTLLAAAETKATEADAAAKAAEAENMRLKVVVGHAETATLTNVDEEYNKDMTTYAANYNDANLSYRAVCQWLFSEVQRKNESLSDEKERGQQLKDQNAALEAAKDKQIAQAVARADKAETDLATEVAKFNASLTQSHQTIQQQEAAKAKIIQDSHVALTQVTEENTTLTQRNDRLTMLNKQKTEKIIEMDPPVIETPDGKIRHVSQSGTVWINLGRVHGLSLLTNFSVYPQETTDLTATGSKAAIEIISLMDDTAEARIVADEISDPIMPGDLIFTPLWQPGQRQRFALTDGIDLNGDGKSDINEVRNLIKMNGGEVDFWFDDQGQTFGQMNMNTRYLVMGKEAGDGNTVERINARTAAVKQAKEYGLRIITLADLLNRMGYVRQNPVVPYGRQATARDFPARPADGVPKVSPGRVSDLYEQGSPPRPSIDTAY